MASRRDQKPVQMRQFPERFGEQPDQFASTVQNGAMPADDIDDDDDEEEDEADIYAPVDRIRRSYHLTSQGSGSAHDKSAPAASTREAETIQVTLDESYFARERRFVVSQLANARQKLSSLQLFNPIQNETAKQQQQEWTEKEKYTLDSLNEFHGPLGERFRFDKPDDGREVWPSKLQYFLAITSYSIGLGNVIRFPILVQRNGGLAFIIPFMVMLLLEGIPLFYLELAIGQRTRKAAISCWNLVSPFAVGIGIASAAVSFLIGLYYNTVVAWTLLYSWASLTRSLPQSATGASGVDGACTALNQGGLSTQLSYPSSPHMPATDSDKMANLGNATAECLNTTPFEYFWYREMLDISSSVSDWVHFNWPVALCLCLAWLISYLCLVRGLSTSKQLVYVVSTFPYVILCVFLLKALSLHGMSSGLSYFIEPDWPKLFDPYVWLQAAAQVFFSLGLGFGGLIALSSYNQVNNNCYRDAIKVCLINFVTSLLAGIVVFAILGFRATLNFERCQMDREQQIDFYLADYNLKSLEYGSAFEQLVSAKKSNEDSGQQKTNDIDQFVAIKRDNTDENGLEDLMNEMNDEKKFSLDDAIDSIKNLDRQLDLGSPSGSFDYGNSDTEFILNASNIIDRDQLDRIVANIQGLPKCSVKRELDESTRGPGLIFVVMAEAISQFDSNANSWQIVFFLMILALGFDSQFGNLEGLLSSLTDYNFNLNVKSLNDQSSTIDGATTDGPVADLDHASHHLNMNSANGLPNSPAEEQQHLQALKLRQNQLIRQWATGCICGLSLVISIVMFAHGAGSYMLAIFDEYASSFSLVIIALFELLAISYIYGLKRFSAECELMTGKRPPFLVLLSWRYISPILLLLLIFATIKQFTMELDYEVWQPLNNDSSNGDSFSEEASHLVQDSWPYWAIEFGVLLIVCCVIWIPLIAALRAVRIIVVPEEQQQRWFPADELREYHQLRDHEYQVSKFERIFFGFKQDDD